MARKAKSNKRKWMDFAPETSLSSQQTAAPYLIRKSRKEEGEEINSATFSKRYVTVVSAGAGVGGCPLRREQHRTPKVGYGPGQLAAVFQQGQNGVAGQLRLYSSFVYGHQERKIYGQSWN